MSRKIVYVLEERIYVREERIYVREERIYVREERIYVSGREDICPKRGPGREDLCPGRGQEDGRGGSDSLSLPVTEDGSRLETLTSYSNS